MNGPFSYSQITWRNKRIKHPLYVETCQCVKCNYELAKQCMEAILTNKIDKSLEAKLDFHCKLDMVNVLSNEYDAGENVNHLELEAKARIQQFLKNQIDK